MWFRISGLGLRFRLRGLAGVGGLGFRERCQASRSWGVGFAGVGGLGFRG